MAITVIEGKVPDAVETLEAARAERAKWDRTADPLGPSMEYYRLAALTAASASAQGITLEDIIADPDERQQIKDDAERHVNVDTPHDRILAEMIESE